MKKTLLAISFALVMVVMSVVPAFAATTCPNGHGANCKTCTTKTQYTCPNGHGANCKTCVASPEATCPKPTPQKPPVYNIIIDDCVTSPKTGVETNYAPYIILLMSVATCGAAATKLIKTSK